MKIQKVFIEFLKKEGVFEKYVENWEKDFAKKPINDRNAYVVDAFPWCLTSESNGEGFDFWNSVSVKWENNIERLKEKKNPADYHTRCHDCGRFVKFDLWVKKSEPFMNLKMHCLCVDCRKFLLLKAGI